MEHMFEGFLFFLRIYVLRIFFKPYLLCEIMGIVLVMFAELWATLFRHVQNNGFKLFKPKWHVPVQNKGLFY